MMDAQALQQFCADADDIRYYLCAPWSRGEWTYATNGHIIVRVPRLADVPDNDKAPDTQKLFANPPDVEWLPVPQATTPPDETCENCHGAGCYVYSDENEDCEFCNRTGKVECFDGMVVSNGNFALRYLAMIQGWEIAPTGPKTPAWIRNGDATGLLMPRRMK